MNRLPIQTIAAIIAIAFLAGCRTHISYQVNLVGADGQSVTTLTRTQPDEDEMINALESFFQSNSGEPESINQYLTEAKLFLSFFPESPERTYVLHHALVAALRGVERPAVVPGAYSVETEYVRHGFAGEAIDVLDELREYGSRETTAFLESLSHTLEKGIWYDQAVHAFSSGVLQSVVIDYRRRVITFDHDTYTAVNGALRRRYPKWYEDTRAAAVAERMQGGTQ
jgi:ABC-type cobalt transport system substrate-binding protein